MPEIDERIEQFEGRAQVPQTEVLPDTNAFFLAIERLAANPDVDVAKIKQIMDMQEHILDRDAEQAFNASMMKVQGRIELVAAKKRNEQTKSNYAPLKDILIKTKDVYTSEGFSLMFYEGETTKEGHVRVGVDIMHEQGCTKKRHADIAVQTTGLAGKAMMTQVHGEGSAFSYGRRYLTCLIFNIPTGDDDGNAAGGEEYITDEQLSQIIDMANESGAEVDKFLRFMGVESLEQIPATQFQKAMSALQTKLKAKQKADREGSNAD